MSPTTDPQTLEYIDSTSYFLKKDLNATSYIQSLPMSQPKVIQYNQEEQGKIDTSEMCVVYANVICVSTMFSKAWTRQNLEDCCLLGVKNYGLKLEGGNNTTNGAKTVAVYNNKKFPHKAAFFATEVMDKWFELSLDNGLLAVLTMPGYTTGSALIFAQLLNGLIKGGPNMKSSKSHAIAIGRGENGGYMLYNSDAKKSKAYCSKAVFQDLMKQQVFYITARVRLPLGEITDLTPEQYKAFYLAISGLENMEKYGDEDDKRIVGIVTRYIKRKYNL